MEKMGSGGEAVDKLRQTLENFFTPLLAQHRAVLLMYADHVNLGDGLIWLGTQAMCDSVGATLVQEFPECVFSKNVVNSTGADTILISGGGNFGDIYERYNTFRINLLSEMSEKRIIQLPVTIHYKDKEKARPLQEAIEKHPDFILTVRDQVSYDLAKDLFSCEVFLIPDMAFCTERALFENILGRAHESADEDALHIMRRDAESGEVEEDSTVAPKDWSDFQSTTDMWLDLNFFRGIIFRNYFKLFPQSLRQTSLICQAERFFYQSAASYHKRKFIRMLGKALDSMLCHRVIVTNRLHVHIFCRLNGIPNILIPNNYIKNIAFYETWSADDEQTRLCRQGDDLKMHIESILGRSEQS